MSDTKIKNNLGNEVDAQTVCKCLELQSQGLSVNLLTIGGGEVKLYNFGTAGKPKMALCLPKFRREMYQIVSASRWNYFWFQANNGENPAIECLVDVDGNTI